ncbi:AraC family ligand binding domain-containing protein [Dactylosporangium sp. NPDC049140]|uniref:AraC family ligand binding domain-containing protein n=1 Tax=Dactylosporangium sp. NPDC049140 TaxID=3155647 RepID=UPI0033FA2917
MPIYAPGDWLNDETRPAAAVFASAGRFAVPLEAGRFDRHFHDTAELWFVAEGRAKIFVDGAERYVQSGDIVLTVAGDVHDFLEVYEAVRGFFVEGPVPPGGRGGHRHTGPEMAAGHDVPARPVPDDFPTRYRDRASQEVAE